MCVCVCLWLTMVAVLSRVTFLYMSISDACIWYNRCSGCLSMMVAERSAARLPWTHTHTAHSGVTVVLIVEAYQLAACAAFVAVLNTCVCVCVCACVCVRAASHLQVSLLIRAALPLRKHCPHTVCRWDRTAARPSSCCTRRWLRARYHTLYCFSAHTERDTKGAHQSVLPT